MRDEINQRPYDIKCISKYLGLTEWGVRNLVKKGLIPVVRNGTRRILFDKVAIDEWIKRNTFEVGGKNAN